MSAGWSSDPTGRFGQRWYDGAAWSEHVVGANGGRTTDALPETDAPYPPPNPQRVTTPPPPTNPMPSAPMPPTPVPYAGAPAQPSPTPRYRPGAGLALGALGTLLAALSLLGVPWGAGTSFLDLSSNARSVGADGFDNPLLYLYAAGLGFVLLALTAVLVLMVCLPLPATNGGNSYSRVIGSLLAGIALVLHAMLVAQINAFSTPEAGAWLALVGFPLASLGMVLGARRTT